MEEDFIIGTREIMKAMEKGEIEKVIVASNAPEEIKQKLFDVAQKKNVTVEEDGDEIKLATKVGKPFPIAAVGYLKGEEEE